MDETEDHEPRVANLSESTVKLTTLVTTESKMEEVVKGDAMVEVLDSEVLVDAVRRKNEEVGSGHGDDGVKGANSGDGGVKGAGKDDLDVDGDDAGVERGEERKFIDEGRRLGGCGTEVEEDSGSHGVELRSIENGVRRCTSQGMPKGDGNGDDNARASLSREKEASEVGSAEAVDRTSFISETKTKEGVSTDDTQNQAGGLPMSSSIVESEVPDRSSAGSSEDDLFAGPRRDGNGESENHLVSEQSDDGVKEQTAGAISQTEDGMIKPSDPVACSQVDKQQVQVQSKVTEADEKLNGTEESESQPLLPDKSHVRALDQGNGCTPDTISVDRNAMEGVAQFSSGMEENQQEQETVRLTEQAKSPDAHEEEDAQSDSMESPSNDENDAQDTTLFDESGMIGVSQDASDMEDSGEGQEEADVTEEVHSPDELEVDEELVSDSARPPSKEGKSGRRGRAKSKNLVKNHPVSYQLPPEDEGDFTVSDLVWGKVKSHPWWPGQIFHPFDCSEKAKKYIRKDCYLVAYFGDKSFAWNDGSVLKPFFKHFSEEEKQSNSESFQNAVTCALEEVSRRVELGLACPCISEEVYDKIKYQIVDNAGIRQESSKREGVDWSTGVDHFQPGQLVQYIKALALSPSSGASRLDLVILKAQLLAFSRLKGFDELPDFQYYDGILECDAETPARAEEGETQLTEPVDAKTRLKVSHRRKHNLKDIVYQRRKEKSITELMGESVYYFDGDFDSPEEEDAMLSSPTSGAKRKAPSDFTDDFTGQQSTKTISVAKVSHGGSPNPQQSFKVGECIRRVASQLAGSPSILKSTGDDGTNSQHVTDDADQVSDPSEDCLPEEEETALKTEVSTEEMLSQLHISAQDPMKRYSFLADIISFFSEFRNLAVLTQRQKMRKGSGRKRKQSEPATEAPAEFDDRNDSYWTDMVVQNSSEAKPRRRGRKRKEDRPSSGDPDKPLKSNPRKSSRKKQYFYGNHESVGEMPSQTEKQPEQEQLPTGPTELILNFSESGSIPSEVNLNKMFKRFGPLKESETEMDSQNRRAKVVFKKRSDAEVAYSSAAMFNIFGAAVVNYQLNHIPSAPPGGASLALADGREDAS